jgi:bifunctional DNA-binding transcriptional regulator/antitoxin component of YhaV-PrlF toxin-antitoxin module
MSLYSTLSVARTGTTSLRATIPEGIVAFLGLKEGEKLDWKMEVAPDGERFVIVRKYADIEEARQIAKEFRKKK